MATVTEALKTDIVHKSDLIRASNGDFGKISGLNNLKLALFHRLVTVPGSLVHRPTYGVGIGQYQNGPNSFGLAQKLAGLIGEQFKQDPRVEEILSVSVSNSDSNPSQVIISVSIKPVGYTEIEMKFTPFSEGL